jgi:hypothetical protein
MHRRTEPLAATRLLLTVRSPSFLRDASDASDASDTSETFDSTLSSVHHHTQSMETSVHVHK